MAVTAIKLFMALNSRPPSVSIDAFEDKFEHMLDFAVLSFLARFAFISIADLAILLRLFVWGDDRGASGHPGPASG